MMPKQHLRTDVSANEDGDDAVYAQRLAVTETRRLYSCQTKLPMSNEEETAKY